MLAPRPCATLGAMSYRHIQWGYTPIPVVAFFAAILVPITRDPDDAPAWLVPALVAFMVALVLLVVYFSRLEVVVADGRLTVAFGMGKPHRVIELSMVRSVEPVRNRWWYGWGVRRLPHAWMYNVWGLDAVDVTTEDATVFRIGTNDVERLVAAITLSSR